MARLTDPDDRRVARVRITAEGRRTLQRIRTLKNAFLTRRLAGLDPADLAAAQALASPPRAPGGRRMSPIARAARQTFKALQVRNYRLYFIGQVISASGTWMHAVALGLLVLSDQLHGNGFNVGIVTALQFLPMLLLGSWGGLVVDRVDKRRLLYVTQAASGVLALALGLLVALGTVDMWEVYLISTLFGVVNLFDNPARQTFVSEMVGRDLMPNAISLNSVVMNSARVIGPAIGGVLIFAVGLAACFLFNAASYVAVLVALFMMRPAELHGAPLWSGPRARSATACATCGRPANCAIRCWPWRSWASSPSTSRPPSRCWPPTPSTAAPAPTAPSWQPWGSGRSSAV